MKKFNSILLIDDNPAENNYNKIVIEDMNIADNIEIAENGLDALNYLNNTNNPFPELIILDLYIPKMNGWEFIEEYRKFDSIKKSDTILVILSNTSNPADIKRAKEIKEVTDFELKPLNSHKLNEILERNFKK